MKIGFDNDKYLAMQSAHIRERIAQFDNKLYLEFGGKLFDDYHASRVLPGFQPDSKLQMLLQLKEQAEIVIVISAEDIVANKMRGDYGITYDVDVLRLIDAFQGVGLFVGSVSVRGVISSVRSRPRIFSPSGVPPGSRVRTTSCPAALMRRSSPSICVVLPAPSMPSKEIKRPVAICETPN